MQLFIDGDGCPVKSEVITLAKNYGLSVKIITSIAHYTQKDYPANVTFQYVDKGSDRADYEIVSQLKKDDILITQDYGLASLALAKCQAVFHHSGMRYTLENIDYLLANRYISQQVRKSGHRTKGPSPFTKADRLKFYDQFNDFLSKLDLSIQSNEDNGKG
ncbi:MAG TPA: YaiI/YqxD family protein [Enterococcus columbae]|nr:YaiI/YqxD family protein [Enterococcus columbae]